MFVLWDMYVGLVRDVHLSFLSLERCAIRVREELVDGVGFYRSRQNFGTFLVYE